MIRIAFSTGVLIASTFITCFGQGKNILQGTVRQSDGTPMKSSAVYLIQYNPATKTCTIIDSSYTDAAGKYSFSGSQQYYVLAKPDEVMPNELPTYFGNSLFSGKAAPVSINFGDAVMADFTTSKKTPMNGGVASIGGTISLGKSLGTVSNITLFLADKDKMPVAVTSTNAAGNFKFKSLPHGTFYLWVDFPGVDNTNSDAIVLNSMNANKDNLHFQVDDGVLIWLENSYSSIKDALATKESVFILSLNSLQHDVAEKSLVIAPDGSKMLSLQIGEFVNLESLSIDLNMINFLPADLGKLAKLLYFSANLNKISSLPAEMANLKNLRSLNLGKNNFNKFPELVLGFTSLEFLNFENNPIPALPAGIKALKNLKELNLSSCFDLLALPIQIGELINLEVLDLSNCAKLKSLPKELNKLTNLKVLDLTGTKLNASSFKKAVPGCEVRVTKK